MVANVPTRDFAPAQRAAMDGLTKTLPTKAAKMRALEAAGYARAEIAAYLETSYQHVRNVLGARVPKETMVKAAKEALRKGDRTWGSARVGDGGELRLPANVLSALEAEAGMSIGWSLDGDVLILMGRDAGLRFVQELATNFSADDEKLLSEQLIKERRAEAAFEELKDTLMHG